MATIRLLLRNVGAMPMVICNRSLAASLLSTLLAIFIGGNPVRLAAQTERSGTAIKPGDSINLFTAWPKLSQAPREQLATIEFFVRPDTKAIDLARSFILVLSDRRGQNTAGISLTMRQGTIRASVLGIFLDAKAPLVTDRSTHVALTIDPQTVNKQARLWIDGQLVADKLVLERWPQKFEVAEMLSDHWNQKRLYSGHLGDVRISRVVRYRNAFAVPARLVKDDETKLYFSGGEIPLRD